MKIMIISDQYPPYHYGGMAQHTFHMSQQLASLNHKILLLLPNHFEINTETANIEIRSVLRSSYYLSSHKAGLCKKEFNPDVIHIVTAGMFYPSLRRDCPVIQRVVGNDFLRPWKGRGFMLRNLKVILPRLSNSINKLDLYIRRRTVVKELKEADLILANSEWTRGNLYRKGIHENKVIDFIGGVDTDIFNVANRDTVNFDHIRRSKNTIFIITAGHLIGKKGFDTIIKCLPSVIKDYPNLIYLIAGDGPDRDRLMNLAKSLDVINNIIFLGSITQKMLVEYMLESTIYVQVSRNHIIAKGVVDVETMGRTYFEAGACGLPVIAANVGGVASVVKDDFNGILVKDPEDVNLITEKIKQLLSNPSDRERLGRNGKSRAEKEFSWNALSRVMNFEAERLMKNFYDGTK